MQFQEYFCQNKSFGFPLRMAVSCPIQCLNSVCPATAEQEEAFFIQLTAILLGHNCGQPVDSRTKGGVIERLLSKVQSR